MTRIALLLSVVALALSGWVLLSKPHGSAGDAAPAGRLTASNEQLDALAKRFEEDVEKAAARRDERLLNDWDLRLRKWEQARVALVVATQVIQNRAEGAAHYNAGKLEGLDAQLATTTATLEKLAAAHREMMPRVAALEARPIASAAAAPPAATPGATPPKPPVDPGGPPKPVLPNTPPEDPEVVRKQVEKAIADLASPEPDVLNHAIIVVRKRKALVATSAVVKILAENPDYFTRMAAAEALGEMQ